MIANFDIHIITKTLSYKVYSMKILSVQYLVNLIKYPSKKRVYTGDNKLRVPILATQKSVSV